MGPKNRLTELRDTALSLLKAIQGFDLYATPGQPLPPGGNVSREFRTRQAGLLEIAESCWKGMLRARLAVLNPLPPYRDDLANLHPINSVVDGSTTGTSYCDLLTRLASNRDLVFRLMCNADNTDFPTALKIYTTSHRVPPMGNYSSNDAG